MDASVPRLCDKVLVDSGGHWIQQERPAEVNAALLRFLFEQYAIPNPEDVSC